MYFIQFIEQHLRKSLLQAVRYGFECPNEILDQPREFQLDTRFYPGSSKSLLRGRSPAEACLFRMSFISEGGPYQLIRKGVQSNVLTFPIRHPGIAFEFRAILIPQRIRKKTSGFW